MFSIGKLKRDLYSFVPKNIQLLDIKTEREREKMFIQAFVCRCVIHLLMYPSFLSVSETILFISFKNKRILGSISEARKNKKLFAKKSGKYFLLLK
jgi:hypothetical protein